ncbi:anti-sigma factor [Cellulomonas endophytica]|uniref:anti-sigma factor n=1 Tax=Cellulomonas endophytica TaxID=2494735 RepID=UPI001011B4FC|nr:anti-sigma factor [Cellulomonas endophytica]
MPHDDRHVDPETLALLALGEGDGAVRAHVDACPGCTAELAQLGAAVAVGRATVGDGALVAPPAQVWNRISAELGLAPARTAAPHAAQDALLRAVRATPPDAATAGPLPDGSAPDEPATADVVPLGRARRRRTPLVAALVGVAAVGAGAVVVANLPDRTAEPVATAVLDAFPDWPDATGTATLARDDRARRLTVQVSAEPAGGDFREVWLIASDGSGLVSLGVLEGDRGTFTVPDGLDLSVYDLVDVSDEPVDGDPAHSGDSIVRGPLTTPA